MQTKKPEAKGKRHISLRARLCLAFIVFTLIVSAMLWFFEVILLEVFYYTSKIKQTQQIAVSLTENYGMENFEEYLTGIAVSNQVCVEILDKYGRPVHERDVMSRNCLLHGPQNYLQVLQMKLESSSDGRVAMNLYDENIGLETLVLGYTLKNGEEVVGYLFLNTLLEPVGSAIGILKELLFLVTVLLLIIGILIAFYLSDWLAIPIVKLTRSAHHLAHGDLNTKFEGGSYREVDELARALTCAEEQISRVDSMQRDLIANVSHDLRTPLTMLKAYAEMIRDLSGDNPVKRNAHLQVIIEETDRLTMLVNDILDLSKFENGSIKPEMQTFDITSRMNDIIARYKGVSEKMGYQIHFTPDEPVQVTCDPGQIERVICNLINNAINYTGEDKNVYVRQLNTQQGVRIEVRDTGNGIEEDKIQRIFDKYYRSENHKREIVGTGLGLSIVKAILKNHEFHYGVSSTLGEGSVFWFLIRK